MQYKNKLIEKSVTIKTKYHDEGMRIRINKPEKKLPNNICKKFVSFSGRIDAYHFSFFS